MKERPILFSAPMVRALLDGSKTQTRRVAKFEALPEGSHMAGWLSFKGVAYNPDIQRPSMQRVLAEVCPYGLVGDRLWVRETWRLNWASGIGSEVGYRADGARMVANVNAKYSKFLSDEGRWRPSIHMPRWASRIALEITHVRVERLNDINQEDAIAEGVLAERRRLESSGATLSDDMPDPSRLFRKLWESINGAGSWAANPWVWVISFKRVKP